MSPTNVKHILLALSLVSLIITGCSTSPARPQEAGHAPEHTAAAGEVVLLRGLFNIFSLGMDEMGETLRDQGINASVHSGPSWPHLGEHISRNRNQQEGLGPLIISGHSYGADDAIRLARTLEDRGVTVNALILVDPTTPPAVPTNVELCVNFYLSNPTTDWMPWLRGVPVQRQSEKTLVVNRDLRLTSGQDGLAAEVNHFNIEEHPRIQQMVIDEIVNVLRRWQAVAADSQAQTKVDMAAMQDD